MVICIINQVNLLYDKIEVLNALIHSFDNTFDKKLLITAYLHQVLFLVIDIEINT